MFSQRSIHGRIAHEIGQQILRGDLAAGRSPAQRDRPRRAISASAAPCARGDQGVWPPRAWSRSAPRSAPRQGARSVEHARPRCPELEPGLARRRQLRPDSVAEMRRMLEPAGAALAAQRATAEQIARIRDAYGGHGRGRREDRGKRSITICAFISRSWRRPTTPFLVSMGHVIENRRSPSASSCRRNSRTCASSRCRCITRRAGRIEKRRRARRPGGDGQAAAGSPRARHRTRFWPSLRRAARAAATRRCARHLA